MQILRHARKSGRGGHPKCHLKLDVNGFDAVERVEWATQWGYWLGSHINTYRLNVVNASIYSSFKLYFPITRAEDLHQLLKFSSGIHSGSSLRQLLL